MVLSGGVAIVGGGLIGSSAALALADGGADVVLITQPRPGAASGAAAGMLAPSVELGTPQMRELAAASRDMYPEFIAQLEARTGIGIELNRAGILELASNSAHATELAARAQRSGGWLESHDVTALEPGLVAHNGAALWPRDGAVDNTQLLSALQAALRAQPRVRICGAAADSLIVSPRHASVLASDGTRVDAERVVVAAGAWSGELPGAALAGAVEPVRGQLVEFDRRPLSHVVYASGYYLVPRGRRTIGGSTMERVGFDSSTTEHGVATLMTAATRLCPGLSRASARAWAGLRPVTRDMLPLIGPDPRNPSVIYACGHSRNGVLLAPLTALLLKELIFEEPLTFDAAQFRPDRFGGTFTVT
ncbi:MAG TPA: FAD-dependent oxidoreductase [Gemmatimonadaceae bacterium]|nr:FAD-dependent oxidoreductase [Gemmatimonadaceae bacterium]